MYRKVLPELHQLLFEDLLRHALLDLICDRARAELILARNARTEAIRQRLFPSNPAVMTIDNEITAFEGLFNPPGDSPYDSALAPRTRDLESAVIGTERLLYASTTDDALRAYDDYWPANGRREGQAGIWYK